MQADLWKRVEALYQAALAQPPEERAAFLLQACPDDPQLRGEVQSLLDQQADFFLESAPLSAIKALSAGAKLGNFEIVELLGRGGMGEVWRARDARLKRDVAIKVLPAGLTRYPDRIARFEREARAAATLTHPNICVIHEVGAHEGQPFIVMEFLEGHTLKHRIGAHPLKTDTLLDWAIQIAGGLEAAHQTGIVHRDIKPTNIFRSAYPEAPHRGPSFENGHAARLGHPDCRRPGGGPPDGNRASRHQADEHLHHHAGAGQDSGLWPSKGRSATSQGSQSGEPHQSDDRGTPDDPRRGGRDSALHVARAGARGRTGCALGPVQLRRGAVRDGDG